MAYIYANENFYYAAVEILQQLGHNVLTTKEAGKDNKRIPDEEVLAFAMAEKRIVVTFNYNHFKRLHRFFRIILVLSSAQKTKIIMRWHIA
jgi:predicted nuclease of predicted toxin-antitoxin system